MNTTSTPLNMSHLFFHAIQCTYLMFNIFFTILNEILKKVNINNFYIEMNQTKFHLTIF